MTRRRRSFMHVAVFMAAVMLTADCATRQGRVPDRTSPPTPGTPAPPGPPPLPFPGGEAGRPPGGDPSEPIFALRSRLVGTALIVRNEPARFGLYSYLLFGSRPTAATRERYLNAIDACYRNALEAEQYRDLGVPTADINILSIPVRRFPDKPLSEKERATWVLDNGARIAMGRTSCPPSNRSGRPNGYPTRTCIRIFRTCRRRSSVCG
jgi:hypothetical protein